MPFPSATRNTAFIAGVSLSAPLTTLAILNASVVRRYGIDNPQLVSFFVIYFLLTVVVFVIDVRSFVPRQLKTCIPMVYFPTDREGVGFLVRVFGRMLVWLLGVVAGAGLLAPLWYFLAQS